MIGFHRIRFLLLAAFIVLNAGAAGADPRIDRIRERYRQVQELECPGAGCEHFRHTVTYNTMLPAVGLQTTTIRFYFLSDQADPEKDPYLLTHTLQKVSVTYNIAASVFYTIEYLYDDKGAPVFYYCREETQVEPVERRYYFDAGSLIKAIVSTRDDDDRPLRYDDVKNFRKGDVTASAAAVKKAAAYKNFFGALLAAEQLK